MPEHELREIPQHLVEGCGEVGRAEKVSTVRGGIGGDDIGGITSVGVREGDDPAGIPKLLHAIAELLHARQHLRLQVGDIGAGE
jgi:hypothetical protein